MACRARTLFAPLLRHYRAKETKRPLQECGFGGIVPGEVGNTSYIAPDRPRWPLWPPRFTPFGSESFIFSQTVAVLERFEETLLPLPS